MCKKYRNMNNDNKVIIHAKLHHLTLKIETKNGLGSLVF